MIHHLSLIIHHPSLTIHQSSFIIHHPSFIIHQHHYHRHHHGQMMTFGTSCDFPGQLDILPIQSLYKFRSCEWFLDGAMENRNQILAGCSKIELQDSSNTYASKSPQFTHIRHVILRQDTDPIGPPIPIMERRRNPKTQLRWIWTTWTLKRRLHFDRCFMI